MTTIKRTKVKAVREWRTFVSCKSFFKSAACLVLWNCFTKSVCVCVPTYLPILACLYKLTHMSIFLSGKYSPYTRNKGPKNPTICFCTSKHLARRWVSFPSQKRKWTLTTDIKFDFHSGLFWCSKTEKHRSRPVRLTGNMYFIIWKAMLMWTKMKSSPEALLEEISKNDVTDRLYNIKKIFLCVMCCSELLKYAFLVTYFRNFK